MKEYSTKDVRNVVLLGSTKSGKTTLAEAMLFEGKVITRMGSIEDKNTMSDSNELEKINQRSIYATPLYTEYQGCKINFIDAPGSDDFIGGAYSAFRVCESGVLLVNAQQGVEVGTESFIRRAEEQKLPMIVAVSQLDADKADWDNVQASLKETFGGKMINVQFPDATGSGFSGIIDVLTMKYYKGSEVLDIDALLEHIVHELAGIHVQQALAVHLYGVFRFHVCLVEIDHCDGGILIDVGVVVLVGIAQHGKLLIITGKQLPVIELEEAAAGVVGLYRNQA